MKVYASPEKADKAGVRRCVSANALAEDLDKVLSHLRAFQDLRATDRKLTAIMNKARGTYKEQQPCQS